MTPDTTTDPTTPDQVPAWVAYSGVAIVGGTALAVLAWYQHLFGEAAHMPWILSWAFSIGLDWGSAVGGIFWFFGTGPVRTWGRAAAILLLVGSTILTCIAWGLTAGWVWAPVGVIHPLVAFLMAKLLTVWRAQRARTNRAIAAMPAAIAELRTRVDQLVADAATAEQAHAAELTARHVAHTAEVAAVQATLDAATARADELTRQLHDAQEDLRLARRRRAAEPPAPSAARKTAAPDWRAHLDDAVAFMVANPDAGWRRIEAGAGVPAGVLTEHYVKELHKEAKRVAAEQQPRPPLAPVADTDSVDAEHAA